MISVEISTANAAGRETGTNPGKGQTEPNRDIALCSLTGQSRVVPVRPRHFLYASPCDRYRVRRQSLPIRHGLSFLHGPSISGICSIMGRFRNVTQRHTTEKIDRWPIVPPLPVIVRFDSAINVPRLVVVESL